MPSRLGSHVVLSGWSPRLRGRSRRAGPAPRPVGRWGAARSGTRGPIPVGRPAFWRVGWRRCLRSQVTSRASGASPARCRHALDKGWDGMAMILNARHGSKQPSLSAAKGSPRTGLLPGQTLCHPCSSRVTERPGDGGKASAVAFLERLRIAGVPDGEHRVGHPDSGRQVPGHERQRPVRLRAVRPDLVDHDLTERDTLPVVRPGRGGIVDDVGVLGDLGVPGEPDRVGGYPRARVPLTGSRRTSSPPRPR